jgi:peptidoglycan hydrolase-like protein with peptidoglycan-binding domain
MLNDAGFYRGDLDGIYGGQTRSAVIAVHKALDMPRTGAWRGRELEELQYYAGPGLPARPGQTDRVEVDLERQLMYLVKGDRVVSTIPISSGNGKPYQSQSGKRVKARTPEGNFTLYRRYRGLRKSYLGELYWPWYFSGGYALHGSRRVPPTPASHGCVRVPMWDADYLNNELSIGMPFHVWRSS